MFSSFTCSDRVFSFDLQRSVKRELVVAFARFLTTYGLCVAAILCERPNTPLHSSFPVRGALSRYKIPHIGQSLSQALAFMRSYL